MEKSKIKKSRTKRPAETQTAKGAQLDTSLQDLDFEESLAQIESIVGDLELGQLGLTESLEQYEIGVKHLKHCYQILEKAEKRVEILNEANTDGPEMAPFLDETADSLTEKADNRSQRRSAAHQGTPKAKRPAKEDNVDVTRGLF